MEDEIRPSAADVQRYLGDVEYPAEKAELLQRARSEGAEDSVVNFLEQIPDRQYNSPTEVSEAMGDSENMEEA